VRRVLFPLLVALAAMCALPATAPAADGMESVFEDEYLLLQQGGTAQRQALDDIAALGADTLRTLATWRSVAPAADRARRPRGFDGSNPAAYPPEAWDPYDDLVRGAQARGLGVLLSPSSPIPNWASKCRGASRNQRRTCKPDIRGFGAFVSALGARYSGTYADENQGGGVLPRVDRWSIWNEPNQAGWLTPQMEVRRGRRVGSAAVRYRALAATAIRALGATGHGADQILLGETAPIGKRSGTLSRRSMPPVDFLRELFCLDRRGRKLRGASARARGCTRYRALAVTGFAHHPYTRGGSQPPRARAAAGEITVSSASRLKRLLDQAGRARRIPEALPIHYTEFGYQSDPPDRLFGVTLEEQARFINEAERIAFGDERVKSMAQYKLVDERNVASFQTGLRFVDGRAKPALDAYRLPIWVRSSGDSLEVWGQIRPARDGAAETVEIQNAPAAGGTFTTVQRVAVSSPKGHFLVAVPAAEGVWRLRWTPRRGAALLSREATASPR